MKYTYRLTSDTDGVTATCVEMDASATAPTQAAAVAALRDAIYERLTRIEAVAPPTSVAVPSIVLEPARDSRPEPQGPGDPPADERGPTRSAD
jgi:hypothetical protein